MERVFIGKAKRVCAKLYAPKWPLAERDQTPSLAGAPRHTSQGGLAVRSLSRAPVIWLFLVVQLPDASDMRGVPGLLRPFDCFVLGLEGLKDMVRVVFNNVILYKAALWPPLRSRLDKDARHSFLP